MIKQDAIKKNVITDLKGKIGRRAHGRRISKMPICDIENWPRRLYQKPMKELSTLLLMMRAQLKFQFQML